MDRPMRYLLMADDEGDALRLRHALRTDPCGRDSGRSDLAETAEEVVRTANLFEAAAALRDGSVDAVLFDTGFSGCRPGDALSLLAGAAPDAPLIVLTDHDRLPLAMNAVRQGAQDYVLKSSCDDGTLRHRLRFSVERFRQARDDARQRQKAEKLKSHYERLIHDNCDAMLVLDSSGRIKFANTSAASLFKRNPASLIGSTPGIPIDNGDSMEIVISRHSGPDMVVDMRLTRTAWDDEPVYLATLRDISLRKRTEHALVLAKQQAEMANEMKSKFLANMSHELRTPLNSILGFTEMMQQGVFGKVTNPRYEDYLSTICHSGRHLLTLINNLLDLSKIEAGREELDEQVVDIDELLHAAARAAEPNAREHGLTLTCDIDGHASLLRADPVKLDQIVLNLLSNAIKFTPEGGRVSLAARPTQKGAYQIVVSDTGCGMDPDEIPQAMGLFMQIRSPYVRNRDRGTGLGLPIARSLTELHDGTLEITSRRGFGTKVTLTFPAQRLLGSPLTRMVPPPSAKRSLG